MDCGERLLFPLFVCGTVDAGDRLFHVGFRLLPGRLRVRMLFDDF